jgi:hypothetical protein
VLLQQRVTPLVLAPLAHTLAPLRLLCCRLERYGGYGLNRRPRESRFHQYLILRGVRPIF